MINDILSLIRSKESYGGNYNLLAHDKASTNRQLEALTLNELLKVQQKNKNKAAGAYQIKPDTLRYLMKKMGLKGTEKFSKDLQDQMAVKLLERRGLNSYVEGTLSPEEFSTNIAKEWASMPLMVDVGKKKAGESYYKGTSGNKALLDDQEMGAYRRMLFTAPSVPQDLFPTPQPMQPTEENALQAIRMVNEGNGLMVNPLMVAP